MGQVSFQGIGGSSPPDPHHTCYPCNRSTLLPFYPVWTPRAPCPVPRAPCSASRAPASDRRLPFILVYSKLMAMVLDPPLLAAVASPRRQEILRLVWDRELSAGAIHQAMPDVSFGAVSLQLRALSEAGLVECRRDHRHRYYRARRAAL